MSVSLNLMVQFGSGLGGGGSVGAGVATPDGLVARWESALILTTTHKLDKLVRWTSGCVISQTLVV